MEHYNDLVEAINGLKQKGYDRDFNLTRDCLVCKVSNDKHDPSQFNVDAFYRFEGMSSTDDNSIIYAISVSDGTKGILIDAYGVYAQDLSFPLQEKLRARVQ